MTVALLLITKKIVLYPSPAMEFRENLHDPAGTLDGPIIFLEMYGVDRYFWRTGHIWCVKILGILGVGYFFFGHRTSTLDRSVRQ